MAFLGSSLGATFEKGYVICGLRSITTHTRCENGGVHDGRVVHLVPVAE